MVLIYDALNTIVRFLPNGKNPVVNEYDILTSNKTHIHLTPILTILTFTFRQNAPMTQLMTRYHSTDGYRTTTNSETSARYLKYEVIWGSLEYDEVNPLVQPQNTAIVPTIY